MVGGQIVGGKIVGAMESVEGEVGVQGGVVRVVISGYYLGVFALVMYVL